MLALTQADRLLVTVIPRYQLPLSIYPNQPPPPPHTQPALFSFGNEIGAWI